MSRIENLGDYNKMRVDLQSKGGNLDALYKDIGDTAVAKQLPKLLLGGAILGVCIWNTGKKVMSFLRERKKMIKNEPALRDRLEKSVDIEPLKPVTQEQIVSDLPNTESCAECTEEYTED